ncbi:hypothetical protein PHMEG_00032708 [Phytophthora megakarya]|uniref:Uncharacterized protein n=1 Tax=Phytophthora megakarya TaxID=4795 RepID=A0A225UV36_9STRA|nr:hypothetical protein PHMEG_00032708 [Phytophthora megakarya]
MLLQDIITLMNDWKEKDAERKEEKSARQRGIESSGALLRRLATRDFEPEDSDSDKVNDSESLLNKTTPRSGRKKKITKRDQLGAVSGALNLVILEAGEEEKAKYEYKAKRLEFEREQQEEKRRHKSIEAEKRRDHEIRIEERRLKAEDEREKRMHDFLLKILTHKNQDSN